MPVYMYECPKCKITKDWSTAVEFRDKTPVICPECNKAHMKRIIAPTYFTLKGSTWAKDGYGNKGKIKDFGEGDL